MVFNRDLCFGVGPKPGNLALFTQSRQFAPKLVREGNRSRHKLGRFIAGKSKHQSLIARSLFGRAFAFSRSFIDALLDVACLLGHPATNAARTGRENTIAVYAPNTAHCRS